MITKNVQVTFQVQVAIDETKFDETFMEEFRASFYSFHDLDDHMKHLAQLTARELPCTGSDFIEGYGIAENMGIKTEIIEQDEEILTD